MKIQIIDKGALNKGYMPVRKHPMDAGVDVHALRNLNLEPGCTYKFPLGFAVEIPNGFFGSIYPRGSMAENGITASLNPIDADYKGEIHAVITNMGQDSYYINEGDRIGQLVILPCVIPDFEVKPLKRRGSNGFGSTGK